MTNLVPANTSPIVIGLIIVTGIASAIVWAMIYIEGRKL
jgi:hypothetical protein